MPYRAHEGLPEQRALIDRRLVADRLASLPQGKKLASMACGILAEALAAGREEVARRLSHEPGNGRAAAQATAFLHDQIVRLTYDFTCERLVGGVAGDR